MRIDRRTFTLGLLASAAAASFMPTRVSANKNQEDRERTMRFATWNMAGAAPGYHGRGLQGITQFIRDNGIDICSLQEVDRFSRMSHYEDFPKYMEEQTGYHAFFVPSSIERPHEPGKPPREYGNCILSRYPILEAHSFFLTGPDAPADNPEWGVDKRVALLVRVNVEGRDVWVAGTHLSYIDGYKPNSIVEYQVKNLLTHINAIVPDGAPLVLGGDFNNDVNAPDLRRLSQAFNCATRSAGPTWPLNHTSPGRPQTMALDHIFTRAVTVRDVAKHVLEDLSDHAGITATVVIPPVKAPEPRAS